MFSVLMSDPLPAPAAPSRGVVNDLILALVAGFGLSVAVGGALDLSAVYPAAVVTLYAAVGVGILRALPRRLPGAGLGPANRITLARVILGLPLVALALLPASVGPDPTGMETRWWIVGLGTVALMFDGLDGYVARRTGTQTDFGARFDMESDAALLLVLSVLAFRSGQVGPWVLGVGLMRYGFVAASAVWPQLRGELFPSMRRKVVCVIQGIALLVAVGPIVPAPLATGVAATALILLAGSFAIDSLWLMRRAPRVGLRPPSAA